MYNQKKILGVIPARGGSVSVPKKNIQYIGERSLLELAVTCAQEIPIFDHVVVSTDDDEFIKISKSFGVDVIARPAELASNDAIVELSVLHALDQLKETRNMSFDIVALLEPTSPFRKAETVNLAIEKFIESNASSLVTVVEQTESLGNLSDSGYFIPIVKDGPRRRQDRMPLFAECGVLYVAQASHLRETSSFVADDWLAHPVSPLEAIDINTKYDFAYAQWIASTDLVE